MRPDYCPMANEPCQRICDVPCSAHRLKPADDSDMAVYKAIAKNYTAPEAQQPRKAVRLTDEELQELVAANAGYGNNFDRVARSIEQAVLKKNGIEE